jgi:signal transduction histidine kinase
MTSIDQAVPALKKPYRFLISAISSGARYVYETLLRPRSFAEDEKRRERILTIVLFCINIFLLLLDSTAINQRLRDGPIIYNGIDVIFFSAIVIVFLWLYYISRIGYFKIAAYIFISLYFLVTLYGSIHFGISMPAGLLSYVLVITMASIIIGTRFGAMIALLSISAVTCVGLFEYHRGVVPHWRFLPLKVNDLIQYSVFLLLLAAISWLSNSEMEKSLRRARTSERLLKDERDNLEILVETRTQALREAERERVAQLSRFAEFGKRSAGLFHDLLGPLGALTLTVSGLKHDDRATVAIDTAIDATRRMQRFMDTIRRQLVEEETALSFSPISQIEEAVQLLHYQATHANVSITIEGEKDITLHGNQFKFTQVIANLISNAIESYHDSTVPEKKVIISVTKTVSDTCVITVTDQGCGIAPDILPRIFNTFFTTKPSGIGLGLATVKDIIEHAFHGTITCESMFGVGTIFTISIPIHHDPNSTDHSIHTTNTAINATL